MGAASTPAWPPVLLEWAVAGQAAQQDVEHRRQEDAEGGDADHAGKDGDAHGLAHLGAGAGRITSGSTPMMKAIDVMRMGRRRRRLASIAACARRAPGKLQLARELDDQDGVLGRQADQHDQADLREDVVVAAGETTRSMAASRPIGTIMMMDSGSTRLS